MLDEAGHNVEIDQPERVAQEFATFVARHFE
jgi:hypothetical protein